MTTIDNLSSFEEALSAGRGKARAPDGFGLKGRVIAGSVAAILLLAGIGGWAATARLSGAVISAGTVLVEENLKVVQHVDGGVVRAIMVKQGDVVAKDDLLLRLDDVQIRVEKSILIGQLAELVARQSRLRAEQSSSGAIAFPQDYLEQFPNANPILSGEQQLFDSARRDQDSKRAQLQLQVEQLREEITGLTVQAEALDDELVLIREERERMGLLADKGLIETTRLNATDRELARMVGSQGEISASIARSHARISELELQILSIDELGGTEALRELRQVDARVAELQDRLTEVEARLTRTEIRAPVSGTINELSVTTLGGVITPAEKLMTIVPTDADLKIEFRIATHDIDQMHIGQPTKLRFSAFNQRTTPEIDGVVTRISAAATSDPRSGQTFYLAEAEATGDLSQLGSTGLVPGMPVEVFVATAEQVAIAYFAKPFTDQVARAFREE
ncbi:HlyD family type I secretion periplasmic adaptor subunit [Devosia rhizoryzae]|uniref:Membrane fusion protein (MFP) family protein n=1 Tax=Devosia rhizoryzae TaxID=2774137 RepID=A0ABX7C8F2_9HYPH|nr:HlyD family type I secretion periplasmic adaptor subunit [Devosia rhizoryzae]QQR40401.1 HlyD family type I secretion periplasmic adaptor subunit [Devosia rhizoryzae]